MFSLVVILLSKGVELTMKYQLAIISFVCFRYISCVQLNLEEGADCPLNKNETGICVNLNDCDTAKLALQLLKIHPLICKFKGILPIVCCDVVKTIMKTTEKIETVKMVETTTTKIVAPVFPSNRTENDKSIDLKEGDNCFLPDGTKGTCELQDKCDIISTIIALDDWNWCCNTRSEELLCCKERKTRTTKECTNHSRLYARIHNLGFNEIENIKLLFEPNFCNETHIRNKRHRRKKRQNIMGGERAKNREFPHMALLGFEKEGNIEWNCGGTLIHERFVLTAAHCTFLEFFGEVKHVRLGELSINEDRRNKFQKDYTISQIYNHPDYKPPTIYNDIALLKLNQTVPFSDEIFPACLYEKPDLTTRSVLQATGWGATEFEGDMSNHLMKVDLKTYSQDECYPFYNNSLYKRFLPRGIDEATQVCAGGKGEERDSCQGDSGGPLQFKSSGMFYSVGITSFGKACGIGLTPGVYTRVSAYSLWIESVIWI